MGEDESIAGLKAKLQALTGVPAPAQKLMFKKLLQDTDVIRDTIKVSFFFYAHALALARSRMHAGGSTETDAGTAQGRHAAWRHVHTQTYVSASQGRERGLERLAMPLYSPYCCVRGAK